MAMMCSALLAARSPPRLWVSTPPTMRRVPPVTAIPSLLIPLHERLRRDRMRGQDSHETMEVRPFSGHRHW